MYISILCKTSIKAVLKQQLMLSKFMFSVSFIKLGCFKGGSVYDLSVWWNGAYGEHAIFKREYGVSI